MVTVGTGGSGTRFIATDYPNEDGLTAGTEKQTGREENLTSPKSNVFDKDRVGL